MKQDTAPDRIWAKESYDSWGAYGHWYEDATGGGTEYIRADLTPTTGEREAAFREAAKEADRYAELYKQGSDGRNTFVIFANSMRALAEQGGDT